MSEWGWGECKEVGTENWILRLWRQLSGNHAVCLARNVGFCMSAFDLIMNISKIFPIFWQSGHPQTMQLLRESSFFIRMLANIAMTLHSCLGLCSLPCIHHLPLVPDLIADPLETPALHQTNDYQTSEALNKIIHVPEDLDLLTKLWSHLEISKQLLPSITSVIWAKHKEKMQNFFGWCQADAIFWQLNHSNEGFCCRTQS